MKIRYGHVTNSSSSSFLLLIDRKTKSALGSVDDILKEEGCDDLEQLFRWYGDGQYNEENLEVYKKLFAKGYYILQCRSGGQSSYNDGNAESLLEEFGVKSKELWNEYEGLLLTEDFELV